MAETARRMTRL